MAVLTSDGHITRMGVPNAHPAPLPPTPQPHSDEAARARLAAKPSEHRALFAGNIDDHFR